MPMIDARFSVPMTAEQEKAMKTRLGKAIECIPGKSESWLMVQLQPEACLYFRGEKEPSAFVEVSILGEDNAKGYAAMSEAVCTAFEEVLAIPADHVYIKYSSTKHWGWNGTNF